MRRMTLKEIEVGKTAKGGYTRAQLAVWGVPWPPPKGWKEALIAGADLAGATPTNEPTPTGDEGTLLDLLVKACINAGRADIIYAVPDLMKRLNLSLPTVADVIGGQPNDAVIKGEISFDDKVYSFTCARTVR